MNLTTYLEEKKAIVDTNLREVFDASSCVVTLKEAMAYSLFSDGKRIRPILAIAACEASGGRPEDVLPFASAIEMIHAYSLIHDDLPCVDNDDLRRGKPTCHKVFGEALAMLAGDALLTDAFKVMTDPRTLGVKPPDVVARVVYEIAQAAGAEGMVGGQVMDVVYEGKKGTKRILRFIHENKTMALIRAAVRVGAIACRAKTKELQALTTYGSSVGLAFQIKDDLLDSEGDEAKVGKRLKKDDAKQTYVKHYGIAASKEKIDELVNRAVEAVSFMGSKAEPLTEIARFIASRAS